MQVFAGFQTDHPVQAKHINFYEVPVFFRSWRQDKWLVGTA
jgi:hypothetical protein